MIWIFVNRYHLFQLSPLLFMILRYDRKHICLYYICRIANMEVCME